MPESTLTPAPVNTATFPGRMNSANRSTAAFGDIENFGVYEGVLGIVGIVMRISLVWCGW